MKKIAVIYGSSTGTTENIANIIAGKLGINDVFDVSKISAEQIAPYDVLILGSSTWGDGELQDDWYDGIKVLKGANLVGKDIALFGCGDSMVYSDTFCNAMSLIRDELAGSGCNFVGSLPADGYSFSDSTSAVDGEFIGAAIDDSNESDKTEERLDQWLASFQDRLQ